MPARKKAAKTGRPIARNSTPPDTTSPPDRAEARVDLDTNPPPSATGVKIEMDSDYDSDPEMSDLEKRLERVLDEVLREVGGRGDQRQYSQIRAASQLIKVSVTEVVGRGVPLAISPGIEALRLEETSLQKEHERVRLREELRVELENERRETSSTTGTQTDPAEKINTPLADAGTQTETKNTPTNVSPKNIQRVQKNNRKNQEPKTLTTKAMVIHSINTRRPLSAVRQEVESTTKQPVTGIRWLVNKERRAGKKDSSVVVFFEKAVQARARYRIGHRLHKATVYEWDRGRNTGE